MLKNLLIQCAELLNRNDLTKTLKSNSSIESITDESIQNDIFRLMSYYNFVSNSVFNTYIDIFKSEILLTDTSGKINLDNFSSTVKSIVFVKNGTAKIKYKLYPSFIQTNAPETKLEVYYSFLPADAKDLNSNLCTTNQSILNAISFEILSEFHASKNHYNESDFWKRKFLSSMFNLKNKKERVIKPTFMIWSKQRKILYFQILKKKKLLNFLIANLCLKITTI